MQTPVEKALKDVNAVLLRSNKHQVWRLPNGRTLVISKTASDHRAIHNQMADLRRAMRPLSN